MRKGDSPQNMNTKIKTDYSIPKERLLTLTNQNYNYNNINTQNSYSKGRNRNLKIGENTIMKTGINLITPKNINSRDYKSFANQLTKSSGKYKENYFNSVANLKESFETPNNINTENLNLKNSYKGFKSYEIPHINTGKISENYRINLFRENLEKSIKYHKPDLEKQSINTFIDEENIKLKVYMNKLDAFAEFNSSKYPNLIQITKMNKLKTSNLKLSNNRYMGVKYDPHNYS